MLGEAGEVSMWTEPVRLEFGPVATEICVPRTATAVDREGRR